MASISQRSHGSYFPQIAQISRVSNNQNRGAPGNMACISPGSHDSHFPHITQTSRDSNNQNRGNGIWPAFPRDPTVRIFLRLHRSQGAPIIRTVEPLGIGPLFPRDPTVIFLRLHRLQRSPQIRTVEPLGLVRPARGAHAHINSTGGSRSA